MSEYRIIQMDGRVDVQILTPAGRHAGFREFPTLAAASAWIREQTPQEYFRGDAIRDTGARKLLYGAEWRVCEYIEGHKAGQECLRPVQ